MKFLMKLVELLLSVTEKIFCELASYDDIPPIMFSCKALFEFAKTNDFFQRYLSFKYQNLRLLASQFRPHLLNFEQRNYFDCGGKKDDFEGCRPSYIFQFRAIRCACSFVPLTMDILQILFEFGEEGIISGFSDGMVSGIFYKSASNLVCMNERLQAMEKFQLSHHVESPSF